MDKVGCATRRQARPREGGDTKAATAREIAYGLRLDLTITGLFTNKRKRVNLTPLDRALTTVIFHFKGFSSLVSHVRLITYPPMTCAICSSPPRVYRAQRHVLGSTLP
jgi:hypothetical protein